MTDYTGKQTTDWQERKTRWREARGYSSNAARIQTQLYPIRAVLAKSTVASIAWQQSVQFSLVAQSCLTLCDPMHTRPPCPSPTPGVHSDSRPSSPWCHPAISSSVGPFSSCPQSLPASESFPMSQLLHMRWPKYWNIKWFIMGG